MPEAVSGEGSRAARLGSHGDRTARKARGLELALLDNEAMRLGALGASDERFFDVRIAGIAGILRDARDSRPADGGHSRLQDAVAEVTGQAIAVLRQEFAADRARGCALAGHAAVGRDDPGVIAGSLATLVQRLLKAVDG